MNDKDYICMAINNMSDHLKEIKIQVKADKYEEANQYVDGIVNVARDLEISLNELFKHNINNERGQV